MSGDVHRLDLVLEIRLDVLEQAVDEVKRVIDAVQEQRGRLAEVERFLASDGVLTSAEDDLSTQLGDTMTRLKVELRRRAPALRANTSTGARFVTEPAPDPGVERLRLAESRVEEAEKTVSDIRAERQKAYASFQGVRRWSVAGLADGPLDAAVRAYEALIAQIRGTEENPWLRFQSEMPRRGQALLTRYMELLASMAVRGFGLDSTVANIGAEGDDLVHLLEGPLRLRATSHTEQRSPLALMGSLGERHVPLGYPEWSLWALPLLGREVGARVVKAWEEDSVLLERISQRARDLCADLYAQYTLGPGYLYAAVFLEFDPCSVHTPKGADTAPDCLRAQILLENLPTLGDGRYQDDLEPIAAQVRDEWDLAREATGGGQVAIGDEDRKVIAKFLAHLNEKYWEVAYELKYLLEAEGKADSLVEAARELEMGGRPVVDDEGFGIRELITVMWLARLKDRKRARRIHEVAKAMAKQIHLASQPSNPRGGGR